MDNEYELALERAKKDRAKLEDKRKELEAIDLQIKKLDAFIVQASAMVDRTPLSPVALLKQDPKSPKPNLPLADLIHKVMDELGIGTFRVPVMRDELIKRGWLEKKSNAGMSVRTAALRRKREFKLDNGEFTRIGKAEMP